MSASSSARTVLAFVAGVATASGGFAIWTRWIRRAHDPTASRRSSRPHRPTTRDAGRAPDVPFVPRTPDAPPSPAPPRMFRGDSQHTGRSGYELPRAPRVLARVPTGGRISAQAVVSQTNRVTFGSHDGVLYLADPADGRVVARLATGDRIYTTPLVSADGHLYFGSDADRFFSLTFRATLDVALATDDDADTSAVAAPDGTLRFAAGRTLYATDADLTVRWRLQFGGKVYSSPAMTQDGWVIVGSQDDGVYAIDSGGAVQWRVATGGDVDATPAVDARGVAYVGSDDGFMYAVRVRDGSLVWRRSVGGYVRAGAALGLDGAVVVGTFGPHPRVVSLDRETGDVRWSVAIPGPPTADFGIASAALVDRNGDYAIGTPDDSVLLIARDGTVRTRIAMPGDVDSSPVLVRDHLLAVGCDDGAMYLLGDIGANATSDPRDGGT